MDVTLRQLRLLIAVAETGSLSAAARQLHITQPTASMAMKALTEQIGLPLHDVVGKRVVLTEAGTALWETAQTMQAAWDTFSQQVSALQGLERGRLRVAVVSTAQYFMPRVLGQFCRAHPGIEVALEIHNRDGVVSRLRHNLDDLYIMSQPPTDLPLEDAVFLPNPIDVIAPHEGDIVPSTAPMSLQELARHRLIVREAGSGTRMAMDACFAAAGLKPQVRLALGSNEAIQASVVGGLGIGILSRQALGTPQGWRTLAVEGFPLPSAWHLVHRKERRLSPVAASFKAHLMAVAPGLARRTQAEGNAK